jgi:ribosome-associated protein
LTDTKPSKSAKKREYLALQKLGEELITLRESDLQRMPLDEELRSAVVEARQMKSRGALRRQKQYIGKLMRQIDADPIRQALARTRR